MAHGQTDSIDRLLAKSGSPGQHFAIATWRFHRDGAPAFRAFRVNIDFCAIVLQYSTQKSAADARRIGNHHQRRVIISSASRRPRGRFRGLPVSTYYQKLRVIAWREAASIIVVIDARRLSCRSASSTPYAERRQKSRMVARGRLMAGHHASVLARNLSMMTAMKIKQPLIGIACRRASSLGRRRTIKSASTR